MSGNVLRQFGELTSGHGQSEFRAHLAVAGGVLFRSNGTFLDTISQFDAQGQLIRTITPSSSATPKVNQIAPDFDEESIYFVDVFGGSNAVRHLDDPISGAQSTFIPAAGAGSIQDLAFGGPDGSQALFALIAISPGPYRISRIAPTGSIQFFDSAELTVSFTTDVGSVAVDPMNGNVYAATGTKIVQFDATGASIGSFPFSDLKPSIEVGPNGNIYVGRFDSGSISVFSSTGQFIETISIPGAVRIIDVLLDDGSFGAEIDTDEDGLSDEQELSLGTDPMNPDTDGDGLSDGTEVEMAMGLGCPDPLNPDSDGDLISDGDEVANDTDPCNPDTDGDGLCDLIDLDPLSPDTSSGDIEDGARFLADFIDGLDVGLFTGPNAKANSGRRNSMSSRVRNAANAIAQGSNPAARALLTTVLEKVDGADPDWMFDSPERKALAICLVELIALLM